MSANVPTDIICTPPNAAFMHFSLFLPSALRTDLSGVLVCHPHTWNRSNSSLRVLGRVESTTTSLQRLFQPAKARLKIRKEEKSVIISALCTLLRTLSQFSSSPRRYSNASAPPCVKQQRAFIADMDGHSEIVFSLSDVDNLRCEMMYVNNHFEIPAALILSNTWPSMASPPISTSALGWRSVKSLRRVPIPAAKPQLS